MKKTSKIILGGAVVVVGLAIAYRAVNQAPDKSLPANEQLTEILDKGGCVFCHSANPDLPFYADLPVAKSLIKAHVDEGYKAFDIEPMMKAIKNGEAVNEVDLAKVEKCVADGTMPLVSYYLAHWGSSLTSAKTDIVLDWVKQHRAQFYPNTLAADEFKNEPVRPIPDSVAVNADKVALGKELYHDTRLSGDGTISCASCHAIETAGVDNHKFSDGIGGQQGGINAPTSYNAVFNFVQFWDGRALTLAEQAAGPPLNPVEMGSKSFDEIAGRLAADADFAKRFTAVYPEGLNEKTITDAIAEYEKTLLTPNCPFDLYLKGDKNAMTAEQIEGYELFKEYKCATCHAGVNMGGLSYELMGQRADYFKDREVNAKSGLTDSDNGRWAQTKVERDRYRFKTPSLRNIALTWPYYHDGSVPTLEKATEMMAEYQVGRKMPEAEIKKVKSFLDALTGQYQGKTLTNTNNK
ncbi:MAG: cytochrome c peroxidase [Prevotellaceae bacterium]|nr:cytochrome c peroxidase [Prevotellaceae bacterium]